MPTPLVDLTDSAEATAYLADVGLAVPSDLDKIITGVSAAMQSFASRNFVSQSYSVALDGAGTDRVSLPNTPITAVSALTIDGVNIPAAASALAQGFVFSETQVLLRGYRFCRGVQNVALTYTAGFVTIPADLRRAACQGVAAVVASFDYTDPRVLEFAAGGTRIKLASQADYERLCLTPDVTAVLTQRARVAPC